MVRAALTLALALAAALPSSAQTPDGVPVTSELVVAKCGSCHKADEQKRMSRISYRRTTPEGWELTVKRMIGLNHVAIEPAEARAIIKYLSDNHGLAPEEARAVQFEAEHRLVDFTYEADRETAVVCSSCHSIGRVMTQRRNKEEWELLLSMHRGYYPLVDNQPMNDGQGFRRNRALPSEPGPDGRPPDARQPMERIVEHLSKTYPLTSAAWTDWAAARQPAGLAGTWAMSGYIAGKGPVYGVVAITADPQAADTFVTESKYTVAGSGETAVRKGRGVVYGGFQWRGRSAEAGAEPWRETMFVERAQAEITGRWFGGAYDELGADVRLVRIGASPIILGPSTPALKTGTSTAALRIYGANLPARLRADQVSLGQGITVTKIVSSTADGVTLAVEVAATAAPGPRDLLVAGAHRASALTVYDKVDSIRVTPQAGLARVGGAVFPKQVQQFEAIAFHNGPDGQANTKDDWNLGLVSGATWAMEEYAATFGDDDLKFVGALDVSSGLFTPNLDGPNPARTGERNNIGDVWVVASVAADPARGIAAPIRARGHLVVAPPVYVKWSATGVGQ